jgi:hypothetical protein
VLIHITIAFEGDRVELRVANPYVHRVDSNLVALERIPSAANSGAMVLEVGDKVSALENQHEIVIKPIYDPANFEAELTAAIIRYYRNLLFQEVRPRLVQMFTFGFFDRFRIDLLMPRFETLSAIDRDRFARSLGTLWIRSEVLINNHQLAPPR